MRSADLLAEFYQAAEAVEQRHLDRLVALGVTWSTIDALHGDIMDPPPFGVAAGSVQDHIFVPGEGPAHIVQPIADRGELVDFVAWRSEKPDDWHLRTGLGTFLGDVDQAISDSLWDEPAWLHGCPLDWLRAGGTGLVVINWSSPEVVELNRFASLQVPDRTIAKVVRAALIRPPRIPSIIIRQDLRRAA